MAVVLRFARGGKKKVAFYRIVATEKSNPRDGKFIELLGTYDPRNKALRLNGERYERWVSVGAQPSGTLAAIVRREKRTAAKAA
ncbi:MAG: 30S ribosomal protein S16 [Myxococcales bacterium]|nr:30S ribosomal protein S16 [Myxococcales bacterium]